MNQGTSHEEAQGPGLLLGDKLFFAACWPAEPGFFYAETGQRLGLRFIAPRWHFLAQSLWTLPHRPIVQPHFQEAQSKSGRKFSEPSVLWPSISLLGPKLISATTMEQRITAASTTGLPGVQYM